LVRDAFCGDCGKPLDEEASVPQMDDAPGVPRTPDVGLPRKLADYYPGGTAAAVVLTVGQVVAVLAGILSLIGIVSSLAAQDQVLRLGGAVQVGAAYLTVGNGVVQILLAAAMFVVCHRAQAAAGAAKHQDAENQRVAQALAALQSRLDSSEVESPRSEPGPKLR
jgi:hypothetical protein